MPNATTNNSLSKICNTNDQSVKPPTFKNVGDCSPNPLRIDAPVPHQMSIIAAALSSTHVTRSSDILRQLIVLVYKHFYCSIAAKGWIEQYTK